MSSLINDIEFELSRNNDITLDLEDIPTSTHEVLLACKEEIERLDGLLEAAIEVIQKSDQVGEANWHREKILEDLAIDANIEQDQDNE